MAAHFWYIRAGGLCLLAVAALAHPGARAADLPDLSLPQYPLSTSIAYTSAGVSTYQTTLDLDETGFDVEGPPRSYNGWCLEDNGKPTYEVSTTLFSSYDPGMPLDIRTYQDPTVPLVRDGLVQLGDPVPWDSLNYLLNHRPDNSTMKEFAAAIWVLLWGQSTTFRATDLTLAMVADARTNGVGFVPAEGQTVAVILYTDGFGAEAWQDTIIEVPVPLPPVPATLGDFVWEDLDGDGIQEPGEPGIPDATVKLLAPDSNGSCSVSSPVLDKTTTDDDGFYEFNGLKPGSYCVAFVPPTGLTFSPADQGTDSLDSDASPSTGLAGPIMLESGEDDWTWDAGLYPSPTCALDVNVRCIPPTPDSQPFTCSDAKPLDTLKMLWTGSETVDVRAWKGLVGTTLLAKLEGVNPGEVVSVSGYAGASNDVIWELFSAGAGLAPSAKLGESTFHLSCSDDGMDGLEDCGQLQGDGKGKSGYLNQWELEGMVGQNGLELACSPAPQEPQDRCSVLPGSKVTLLYEVTNDGDPLYDLSLDDSVMGELEGPFDLDAGEHRSFQTELVIYESTTHTGTFTGWQIDDGVCRAADQAEIEVVNEPCATCKGGVTQLTLRYRGAGSGPLTIYEGKDAKPEKLLYKAQLSHDPFTFRGIRSDGTMSSEISIWIDGKLHTKLHTSCSQPIGPEMISGDFEVITGQSRDNGLLCPLEACAPIPSANAGFAGFEVRWDITNAGDLPLEISRISIQWPSMNGNLTEIKRDNDAIWKGALTAPAAVIESGWASDPDLRTIKAGEKDSLKFKFPDQAALSGEYRVVVEFTSGCRVELRYDGSTPNPDYACSKPVDALTMIWDGPVDVVWVTAWKGSVGSTALTTLEPVSRGDEITVAGLAGSPNDVFWEIFTDPFGDSKLGESDFHISCSDEDLDGAEDCGKVQGDAGGKSGYINAWLLEGMVDTKGVLDCTP